jgi:hypothetical protein
MGGGIRERQSMRSSFEKVVDLIRQHPPGGAIAFDKSPMGSADAAARWFAAP